MEKSRENAAFRVAKGVDGRYPKARLPRGSFRRKDIAVLHAERTRRHDLGVQAREIGRHFEDSRVGSRESAMDILHQRRAR